MDRQRVRSVARMVLYVAAACLLLSVWFAVRLYNGDVAGARWALASFILAVVGLLTATPAGYALVMAK